MSNESDMNRERDDAAIGRLLRLAGERPAVPDDVEARVYARVHDEWQRATGKRDEAQVYRTVHKAWRRTNRWTVRRMAMPIALAASVVLAIFLVVQPDPVSPPGGADDVIGSIARVIGDGGSLLPAAGSRLVRGQRVATGPGEGISVRVTGSESVRLAENTTVVFDDRHELTLLAGQIYADTGDLVYRDRNLVVTTPVGTITDIGTRFVVAIDDALLEVAVREGRVDVRRDGDEHVAVGGEKMTIAADGEVEIEEVDAHDAYWDWAAGLAPAYDIEGKSLFDFLRWAARETGHELVFSDNELRLAAMRTDLHGSIEGFAPDQAIESVIATTNFRYRIEAGQLIIER